MPLFSSLHGWNCFFLQNDPEKSPSGQEINKHQTMGIDITLLNNKLGDLDLQLLDFLLKGHIPTAGRVLDAGCGAGRQLLYFLQNGYPTDAIDKSISEVRATNLVSRAIVQKDVAKVGLLEALPFQDGAFEFIICSRVVHFAQDEDQWEEMLEELRRVLCKTGRLYLSSASTMGVEPYLSKMENGLYTMPNGAIRFAVNPERIKRMLSKWKEVVPYRTMVLSDQSAETTFLLSH